MGLVTAEYSHRPQLPGAFPRLRPRFLLLIIASSCCPPQARIPTPTLFGRWFCRRVNALTLRIAHIVLYCGIVAADDGAHQQLINRTSAGRPPIAPTPRMVLDPAHRNPRHIHLDQGLLDRALAPPITLDDRRLEGLLAKLRYPQPHQPWSVACARSGRTHIAASVLRS